MRPTSLATLIITPGTATWLPPSTAAAQTPAVNFTYSGGDGSSLGEAIIVHAPTEPVGIRAERAWIKDHWPGAPGGDRALNVHDGRRYDCLTITDTSGQKHTPYFDITEFFGKL
jgi:hypothetical protein